MTAFADRVRGVVGSGRRRSAIEVVVACGLLVGALVLGGASSAGFVGTAAVQIGATILAVLLMLTAPDVERSNPERTLLRLWTAFALLVLLQLLPLPPLVWHLLPGRGVVREGFAALGIAQPWMPLSLAPAETLRFAVALTPPLAMLLLVRAFRRPVARMMIVVLIATMVVSVIIGVMQDASETSPLYFYTNTNLGSAVGFFANANHFGTLMCVTLPLAAGLVARWQQGARGRVASSAPLGWGVLAAIGLLALIGVWLSGSFAAVLLSGLAIVGSVLIYAGFGAPRLRLLVVVVLAVLIGGAMIAGATVPGLLSPAKEAGAADLGRLEMWRTTLSAIGQYGVSGAGFGSFQQVYHLFENPEQVTGVFVNHAHDEPLEFLLEGGVPGLLLLLAFLGWFGRMLFDVWAGARRRDPIAQGASVAVLLVLLHSLVDYPLRTAAIATLFAFALALVARPGRADSEDVELVSTPGRHLSA